MLRTRLAASLLLTLVFVSGCSDGPKAPERPQAEPSSTAIPSELQPPTDGAVKDPRMVLALVPADAEVLTITDYTELRAYFGVPDLTSDSLMTDRSAFWERVDREAMVLTDGLLREESSRLWLDHGFSQDDVAWEARFTRPQGPGHVLAFRGDQDMDEVAEAVDADVPPLQRSVVLPEQHLVVSGVADEGEPVLASDPALTELLDDGTATAYVRTDCIPINDALGPDATVEDQDALVAKVDLDGLDDFGAFAVNVTNGVVTARTARDRTDMHLRADLIDLWPETGPVTWHDAFEGLPVADAATGRIGFKVRNPVAAAGLVLGDHLPFAVCNELVPLDEPTGLG
ncbi:hypothetical protein BJ980_002349 [Nocardioides daedukensis]|uniref:Uncharacterized protein n=1 Tax=Nocardioides daedukensis TaxID=634462 RepID=A0A7Y9UR92_9ACTN|nr:hypothetical protein [Nocardioides daedukensis]NYG59426.1 hypothetical protein [Nocardioides daedukensis]